jgi:hypothetical protein
VNQEANAGAAMRGGCEPSVPQRRRTPRFCPTRNRIRCEDVTATQVYTIFDIHPLLARRDRPPRSHPGGFTWHFARPPVQGLDFEMDARDVAQEFAI